MDAPTPMANEMQARAAEQMRQRMLAIVGRLQSEADDRVGKRTEVEERWLEDLRQYHGKYDETTAKTLADAGQSQIFVNMTRPKTDAMAARLEDLLFPTDDKNWGIHPTPIPSLTEEAEAAVKQAEELEKQAEAAQAQAGGEGADPAAMAQAQQMSALADEARNKARELEARLAEAQKRCDGMATEIDDQLKESTYHAVARDQIECGCKLGTGVTKGPVTGDVIRKGWKPQPVIGDDGQPAIGPDGQPVTGDFALDASAGNTPSMRYVDVWNWFPDSDARNVAESDGFFERHLLNKKGMRKLAKLPGFSKEAIRRLIALEPQGSDPSYLVSMRSINGQNSQMVSDRFHVWEYTGCLNAEDMRDLAMAFGDDATLDEIAEIDPLEEMNAIVWFCQNEILKFSIYPYDSGEPIYSVFNLVKDDSSIWGYGIPAIMRDPQRSLNAAWRMMMDNAALATGPQIFLDRKQVEPADGSWKLSPRKIWHYIAGAPKDARVMDQFSINMHQGELGNIIAISQKHIDDETAIPQIAQGEQGSHITKTAQGMSILMNASNTVFRRIVKNFDDDVTVPTIRRFYDWNMQFSDKAEIKGDYEVDARGSSVLLVREMQAQNLFTILLQLGAHPIYGPMLKHVELLRMLMQTFMIPSEQSVLSDADIERIQKKAEEAAAAEAEAQQQGQGQQGASPDEIALKQQELELRQMEIESRIEMSNMESATRLKIAQITQQTAMMTMAEKMNLTLDQLDAKLQDGREERQRKERQLAVETAVTERAGPTGGGVF